MRTIALRLRPGADLKAELLALAAREGVRAGWVLTFVGSLSRVRLRMAGGAEHGTWQGAFEIVALTGTLSPDGGHLHLAVADPGAAPSAATWPRAAPCGPPLRSSWPPTTGWCSAASIILPPATTSWWSASATREARDRRRVRAARVHSTRQQSACGGASEKSGGWIDRFSAENLCGILSSRWHSVPVAATCWSGYTCR